MDMLMARSALGSAAAREFLASMPTVETLMPAIDVSELGPLAQPEPAPQDPGRLTQGPYRGRAVAELSDAELEHAQETCPYHPPLYIYLDGTISSSRHQEFEGSWKMRDEERRQRDEQIKREARRAKAKAAASPEAKAAREARQEARQAAQEAARAAREAWKASMTPVEQTAYDQGDTNTRRRIEKTVKDRELARARRVERKRQEEAERIEAERRRVFFEAHPTADEWDYQAKDFQAKLGTERSVSIV